MQDLTLIRSMDEAHEAFVLFSWACERWWVYIPPSSTAKSCSYVGFAFLAFEGQRSTVSRFYTLLCHALHVDTILRVNQKEIKRVFHSRF